MRHITAGIKKGRQLLLGLLTRRVLIIIGIVLGAVILLQLLYPRHRSLPLSSINGDRIGSLDADDMERYLRERYRNKKVIVKTGEVTTTATYEEAGLMADSSQALRETADYPLWQRLLPLSIFVKPLTGTITPSVITHAETSEAFIKKVVITCNVPAENAQLAIKDGAVVLTPSRKGRACQTDVIRRSLLANTVRDELIVNPEVQILEAERTDAELQPLADQAKEITTRQVTFQIGRQSVVIPKETLASWVKITEDEKTKVISLQLDQEKITQFINDQEKKIYIAPGTTVITVVDGSETARQEGSPGRGLDKAAAAKEIERVLLRTTEKTIETRLVTLPAKVRYNRDYSNDQAGLDALLADLVAEKGDYGIALIELGGQRRTSSADGTKRYITASTYKLFVAYAVLERVRSGQMTWGQQVTGGRNLEQCFDDMIVKSDNPCASTLGKTIGWKNIQGMLHSIGMSNTFLAQAPTNDNFSTASDEALFLAKLERDELVQGEYKERLLSAMRRQVYRKGIPSGTTAPVADKVGFLYGLLHDAAIVYSPRGTYALVILTDNSSWADIADVTARIEALLAE